MFSVAYLFLHESLAADVNKIVTSYFILSYVLPLQLVSFDCIQSAFSVFFATRISVSRSVAVIECTP